MAFPLASRNAADLASFSFHGGLVVEGEGDSQLVVVSFHSAGAELLSHHFNQLHVRLRLEGSNWLYSVAVGLLYFFQPSEDVLLVVVSNSHPFDFSLLFDVVVSCNVLLELLSLALCDGLVHLE